MESSYQSAKVPPPVPPKYHKLISNRNLSTNNGSVLRNGYSTLDGNGSPVISSAGLHVVKIHINAESPVLQETATLKSTSHCPVNTVKIRLNGSCEQSSINNDVLNSSLSNHNNNLNKFDVNNFNSEIINKKQCNNNNNNNSNNCYLYGMPCGQYSSSDCPSDNLDSGTCSDIEGSTPPPLPIKTRSLKHTSFADNTSGSLNSSGIDVDSEEDDYDSINSSEYGSCSTGEPDNHSTPVISSAILKCNGHNSIRDEYALENGKNNFLPDFRYKLSKVTPDSKSAKSTENTDHLLHFHLNEKDFPDKSEQKENTELCDDTFAGCKDPEESSIAQKTITSSRGTIRGVKNRVRAGIATFLQLNTNKTWQEKESGKVIVYTTTMGIVRNTYQRCMKVRQILRTHLVKFEEKDVFMSRDIQTEIKERMNTQDVVVPQVFVEGVYIGDAELIERLNESGELRKIMKPYRSSDACNTCQVCGGYRLLPCNICNGSKKSVHRNNFTTELVALKCMNCDEVGLVKCYAC